jgi:glycosyltransferase involved in cell wall biosynthesis
LIVPSDRKVLMIAYAFPPTGGSGVQRSAKFAKYLPQFGWVPTVWTVDGAEGLPRDETLCEDLPPQVTICASNGCGGVRSLQRTLRGFANARAGEGLSGVASRFAKAVDWRLDNWVAANCFPDDCIGWARRSLGSLRRRLTTEEFDMLYSTYSPASNHWLALELKRSSGLPWVADFRDLWTEDCRYRASSPARRAADRRLEQEILETADVVIGVSPRQTEILASHVPGQHAKFVTITNGFDPDDFLQLPRNVQSRSEQFVLGYVGRFDLSQTPQSWFTALARFIEAIGQDRERFVFCIAGHLNRTAQAKLAATGVRCDMRGYLLHREAISAMCQADALLLCSPSGPNGDTIIPAKLFEYLATSRPILTVGPANSISEHMVQSVQAGVSADFSEGSIVAALHHVFDAWRGGTALKGASRKDIERFSRERLTEKLAGVFDEIVNGSGNKGHLQRELVTAYES